MIGSPPFASASQCADCPSDCLEACFNNAIAPAPEGGVRIQADDCAGCGACIPACAFGLIRLQSGVAQIVPPNHRPQTPQNRAPERVRPPSSPTVE
ncbi:Fe-S-cluster-containing hydrogenase component 2 [Rhodoblastus acidophilus]|uniref:4Fe-4S dicluster domain-containing protein n=1 Tax=Rhodoblastus acidophilus TaxID=1074 RepID=UPI002A121549|nr:Fe-S-cluster-containing hydrogenase component 2 [Rhodoblastus acidophilus]